MPECRVVPFFGAFLRELREILAATPSLVVLAPASEHARLEVSPADLPFEGVEVAARGMSQPPPAPPSSPLPPTTSPSSSSADEQHFQQPSQPHPLPQVVSRDPAPRLTPLHPYIFSSII